MKRAIVFAGGGSKGAYQIGVWKALNELGEHFDIATGTSIGSINAALYVQHDFDAAYDMWTHLKVDSIMKNGINFDKSFEGIFSQRENLIPFLRQYISSRGADVKPFHDALQRYFDAERFFSSEIDYALVTVKYPSFEPVVVTKADVKDRENMWKWFAASGACFPVFPVMRIGDTDYVDGGYYDNIPVAPAFRLGAHEVVVVDLKPEKNHEGYVHHPRVRYIKPSRDLGSFLNFEPEALRFSIGLGYNDAMKSYGRYLGRVYTFLPDDDGGTGLVDRCAACFTDLLTDMEGRFDFSYAAKHQRINRFYGCTTLLAERLDAARPGERALFLEALEFLLRLLQYDPDEVLDPDDLIYSLKTQVDGMYPLLEYDFDSAFAAVRRFVSARAQKKNEELKKLEDNRYLLITAALIRTLQHTEVWERSRLSPAGKSGLLPEVPDLPEVSKGENGEIFADIFAALADSTPARPAPRAEKAPAPHFEVPAPHFEVSAEMTAAPDSETPTAVPAEPDSETPTAAPAEPVSEAPTAVPAEPDSETPTAAPAEPVSEAPTAVSAEPVSEAPAAAPVESDSETPTAVSAEPDSETPTAVPAESDSEAPHGSPRRI